MQSVAVKSITGFHRKRGFGIMEVMVAALVSASFTSCIEEIDPQTSTVTEQQAKDAPAGFYTGLFSQARELTESIAAKEAEISAMKAEFAAADSGTDPDIDVEIGDFEDIVSATEKDGADNK